MTTATSLQKINLHNSLRGSLGQGNANPTVGAPILPLLVGTCQEGRVVGHLRSETDSKKVRWAALPSAALALPLLPAKIVLIVAPIRTENRFQCETRAGPARRQVPVVVAILEAEATLRQAGHPVREYLAVG